MFDIKSMWFSWFKWRSAGRIIKCVCLYNSIAVFLCLSCSCMKPQLGWWREPVQHAHTSSWTAVCAAAPRLEAEQVSVCVCVCSFPSSFDIWIECIISENLFFLSNSVYMLQSGLIFLPVMKCLTYIYHITTVQKFVVSDRFFLGGEEMYTFSFIKDAWVGSEVTGKRLKIHEWCYK